MNVGRGIAGGTSMGLSAFALSGGNPLVGALGFAGGFLGMSDIFGSSGPDPTVMAIYEDMRRRANEAAEEGYSRVGGSMQEMLARQAGSNETYRTNVREASNQFDQALNRAVGGAPDFTTSTRQAEENKLATLAEYDRRAGTLETDAADRALTYNLANANKIIALGDTLQAANQKAALEGMYAAQPGLKENLRQFDLNIAADAKGILSTDVAAQIARGSAQTALGSGVRGDMLQNLTLRDLGLASYARMDQAVKNQKEVSTMVEPFLRNTQVDRQKLMETMGMSTDLVSRLDAAQLESWKGDRLKIDDDRRADAALVLGFRETGNRLTYGGNLQMEGNIYGGNTTTNNNVGRNMSEAAFAAANIKAGAASQFSNNASAAYAAQQEGDAALWTSGLNSVSELAGAYMQRNNNNSGSGNSMWNNLFNFNWGSNKVADGSAAGFVH